MRTKPVPLVSRKRTLAVFVHAFMCSRMRFRSSFDSLSRNCTERSTPAFGQRFSIRSAKRRGPPRRPDRRSRHRSGCRRIGGIDFNGASDRDFLLRRGQQFGPADNDWHIISGSLSRFSKRFLARANQNTASHAIAISDRRAAAMTGSSNADSSKTSSEMKTSILRGGCPTLVSALRRLIRAGIDSISSVGRGDRERSGHEEQCDLNTCNGAITSTVNCDFPHGCVADHAKPLAEWHYKRR